MYANGFAMNSNRLEIVLTDYMINHLTEDEIKAIIYHEIGHFHFNHIKKRFKLKIILFLVYLILALFFYIMNIRIYFIPVIVVLCYVSLFTNSKIYRKQESEADGFMIQNNITAEIAGHALIKLQEINYMKDYSNIKEKVQTHPSFKNRLDNLRKFEDNLTKSNII